MNKNIFWAIVPQSSNLVHKACAYVLLVTSSKDFWSALMVLYLIKTMFLYQETTWFCCDLVLHWSRGIIYLFWVTFIYLPIYSCVVIIIPTGVFLCESCWNRDLIVPSENSYLKTLLFILSEWCMTLTCNVFWGRPQLLIC